MIIHGPRRTLFAHGQFSITQFSITIDHRHLAHPFRYPVPLRKYFRIDEPLSNSIKSIESHAAISTEKTESRGKKINCLPPAMRNDLYDTVFRLRDILQVVCTELGAFGNGNRNVVFRLHDCIH